MDTFCFYQGAGFSIVKHHLHVWFLVSAELRSFVFFRPRVGAGDTVDTGHWPDTWSLRTEQQLSGRGGAGAGWSAGRGRGRGGECHHWNVMNDQNCFCTCCDRSCTTKVCPGGVGGGFILSNGLLRIGVNQRCFSLCPLFGTAERFRENM